MQMQTCGSSRFSKKAWVCISKILTLQIRKAQKRLAPQIENPQNATVRKPNKLFKCTNLRICDLRNLFADQPTLLFTRTFIDNTFSRMSAELQKLFQPYHFQAILFWLDCGKSL